MRRRDFITLIGGAALAPLAARAQQRIPRIGVLLLLGPEVMGPFRPALRELGYIEGKTIAFEFRSAEGKAERLPALAAELANSKVDVILASLTPAVVAAKNAAPGIPIVRAPAADPVGIGLVASIARPGGNVTGVGGTGHEIYVKNLELIRDILPVAKRVAVLANEHDPFTEPFLKEMREQAASVGIDVLPVLVRSESDLPGAFETMIKQRADAVMIQGGLAIRLSLELALKHRLPSFANQTAFARLGAVAAYGASIAERGRQIADYVDRILKGAKPADLPVQQPTKFELTINIKTANALGITLPPTLLGRADEVIE